MIRARRIVAAPPVSCAENFSRSPRLKATLIYCSFIGRTRTVAPIWAKGDKNATRCSLLAACVVVLIQPLILAQTQQKDQGAAWRKDLALLTRELPAKHKNLFSQDQEERLGSIRHRCRQCPWAKNPNVARFVIETMRHLARVGDSHTSLTWHKAGFAAVPLQFMDFEEGLFIFGYPAVEPRWKALRVNGHRRQTPD